MASIVQKATALISSVPDQDLVWPAAPTEGNDVVVLLVLDASKTMVRPSSEVTGAGWATRIGFIKVGSEGNREVAIETAEVASGAGTTWNWDTSGNAIVGLMGIEIEGYDLGGTLFVESIVDASTPAVMGPLDGDGGAISGPHVWVMCGATKNFNSAVLVFADDDGFTEQDSDESESGTNWGVSMWTKLLTGVKPNVTLTLTGAAGSPTGSGLILGIPEVAAAADVYPPFPRHHHRRVRM